MSSNKAAPAQPATIVSCPICGKAVEWVAANRNRPFCSERCKQIDLGAWANDEYRVPASVPDGADGSDAVGTGESGLG